jgi:hypothetical protein
VRPPPRRALGFVLGAVFVALLAFASIYPLLAEEWEILLVLAMVVHFALLFAPAVDPLPRRGKGRVIR